MPCFQLSYPLIPSAEHSFNRGIQHGIDNRWTSRRTSAKINSSSENAYPRVKTHTLEVLVFSVFAGKI